MTRSGVFAWAMSAALCVAAAGFARTGDSGAAGAPEAAAADPVPNLLKSPADVARGKAIFVGTCGAYCHHAAGAAANAPGDAPDLFDCYWMFGGSDQQIFHTITTGVAGTRMVSFKNAIPDEDIWRIVAYLKSASRCGK